MKQKLANCPKFGDSLTGSELDVEAMLEAKCERLRNKYVEADYERLRNKYERLRNKYERLENELDAANQHVKILYAVLVERTRLK